MSGAVAVGASAGDGYATLRDGTVWAWGTAWNGMLGNGSGGGFSSASPLPVQVSNLAHPTVVTGALAAYAIVGAPVPPFSQRYVALGDSYSSGEGNPPFIEEAGSCDRSTKAWPNLLGREGIQCPGRQFQGAAATTGDYGQA